MILCENISKSFRNQEILKSISIEFNEGEIVALLGPNGAGKTTFLEILCGMSHASQGRVLVDGICMKEYPQDAKARIGNAPQGPSFFPHLTGRENMELMAALRWAPGTNPSEEIKGLLQGFGLFQHANRPAREYSEGMGQKLSIAMALIGSPKHLVLDESLNGLDPASLSIARRLIRKHADEGGMVLMTTHILPLVEDLADRVVLLHHGEIRENRSMAELQTRIQSGDTLEDLYLQWTRGGSTEEDA